MSIDYPLDPERYPVITDDRSLRRERFLPESSSAEPTLEPTDPNGDSNNAESKRVDLSCLPADGYNISRRSAPQPFSRLSTNRADVAG